MSCDADVFINILNPAFYAEVLQQDDGTADDPYCQPCTECESIVGMIYEGPDRFLFEWTENGDPQGAFGWHEGGAYATLDATRDGDPALAYGYYTNNLYLGLEVALFCPCLGG